MYSKEEHKQMTDALLSEGADTVGVLLQLCDNYDEALLAIETKVISPEMEDAIRVLTEENVMLKRTNTELYLRLGTVDAEPDPEPEPEPEPEKKISYEDIGV